MRLGVVAGYCVLWGEISNNLAGRGSVPWRERIGRDTTVGLAEDLDFDGHHVPTYQLAGVRDGTLTVGLDDTGVWFEAALAPTRAGFDLHRGLREAIALDVSPMLAIHLRHWDKDSDHRWVSCVDSCTITAISVLPRGTAAYPLNRCWLGRAAELADAQARSLRQQFEKRFQGTPRSVGIKPPSWASFRAMR